jgi:hypothetical protein
MYEGPREGDEHPWTIGLYYSNTDNRLVPEGVGLLWAQGEWQQYAVDLMATDEASSVPYRLREFAVLGQGHSYDARIAGISLVGD